MTPLPLTKYIDQLKALDGLTAVDGKPRMLQIVGDRLYWLQGMNQELYSLCLSDPGATPSRVIEQQQQGSGGESDVKSHAESKEEELLRERLRSRVMGITSYRIRESDGAVFFTSGTNLFFYLPTSGRPPLKVFDYITDSAMRDRFSSKKPFLCIQHAQSPPASGGSASDSAACLNTISFVYASNLYVATVTERDQADGGVADPPLAVSVECVTTFGDDARSCGDADYIIQEEFARYTGHYTTPNHIIFSYTDTSMLRSVMLIDGSTESGVEKMAYCRVGDPNARTVLVVYERQTKRYRLVPSSLIAMHAAWAEYVPRFGFKDSNTIFFTVLNRTQEKMCTFSCAIDSLPVVDVGTIASCFDSASRDTDAAAVATATAVVACGEDIPITVESHQQIPWAWVDVQDGHPIHFGALYEVLVRSASETSSAHSHIYTRPRGAGEDAWKPLTCGAWNAQARGLTVVGDRVFFMANARNRLESVVYSVAINPDAGPATAEQLTRLTPSNEHVYCFTVTNNMLSYVSSTATTPAELYITSVSSPEQRRPAQTRSLWDKGSAESPAPRMSLEGLVVPQVIDIVNRRGVPLSGRLFVSPHAASGKSNPLLLYVYGGPHAQLVYRNDFDGACKPIFQMLASLGISVLVADGQMSNANGLRDHSICKHNMGNFETSDYVDWVRHMTTSKDLPGGFCADPARIAVCGWSYGGYATLLAMSQAPDIFKIGFSGAPVGDWTLYDTGYTERYMGLLYGTASGAASDKNENGPKRSISDAYAKGGISAFAANFPDELNRVFIAHGLLDENVHFSNTSVVMTAMIDAGKPCCNIVYPGERHSLRKKKASRLHHDAMLAKTLVELL